MYGGCVLSDHGLLMEESTLLIPLIVSGRYPEYPVIRLVPDHVHGNQLREAHWE